MQSWGPRENIAGIVEAIESGVARAGRPEGYNSVRTGGSDVLSQGARKSSE
jgi:hypothetical protein